MPPGFEYIHEYDSRASVSSPSFTDTCASDDPQALPYLDTISGPRKRPSSLYSNTSEESTELSYKAYLRRRLDRLDEETEDSLFVEEGEIIDISDQTHHVLSSAMDFNPLQHLSSLPYEIREPEGRRAVRQSSRDRSRSPPRRFKRESSIGSDTSHESTLTEVLTETFCTCAISYDCRSRETGSLLDCRTLVLEWKPWHDRMNQEAYDIQANIPPQDAPLAEENMVRELEGFLNHFKSLGPNMGPINVTVEKIWRWTTQMKSHNITAEVLDATQVVNTITTFLADENSQTRTFRHFPVRLEEDLTMLQRKWERGDLTCDPNRGLVRNTTVDQNGITTHVSYLLDGTWEHYISAKFYGEGHLVNGQLFYSRVQLMRDGAHSARIGGISGSIKAGARSIVMGYHDIYKKDYYADIDMGNTIDYMGTALKDVVNDGSDDIPESTNIPDEDMATSLFDGERKPTACTQMLMTSYQTGNPIRVIRSPGLAKQVKNRPKCYRYDGLYRVVKMRPLKLQRQIWSFRLHRLPEQGPLRGFENEDQPFSRGERPGYRRYNVNKYAERRGTPSGRSTRRSRSRSTRQRT